MKTRLLAGTLALVMLLASGANATVLWDQSAYGPTGNAFPNSVSGGPFFGFSVYGVNDVRVHDVWNIQTITGWWLGIDPFWASTIFQGTLSVFPKTGSLPTSADNPTLQVTVPMTATSDGNNPFFQPITTVVVPNLNITLTPGDYWIGITPHAPMAMFDYQGMLEAASPWGDPAGLYDKFGAAWFQAGPPSYDHTMDGTFRIEGTIVTVANDDASWGSVKALYEN